MKIEFDTAVDGQKEAEHLIVMLGALYGIATPADDTAACLDVAHRELRRVNALLDAMPGMPPAPPAAITPEDQPDAGEPSAAEIFGGNPLATSALSIAGVALPFSAPVVPLPSLPLPPGPPAPALPLAPGAIAPLVPAAPTSPAPAEVVLDKEGIPWDARIHQSTKKQTAAGVWMQRRGLNDDAMVARVKAELKGLAAIPVAPVAPPVPAGPLPPAASSVPTTISGLMVPVTKAMTDKILPPTALGQACVAYNLPNIPSLAHRPDLIPAVWQHMRAAHPAFAAATP